MSSLAKTSIGFLGGGKMAEAIIKGLRDGGVQHIAVYDRSAKRVKYLRKSYNVKPTKSNADVVSNADVIVMAVKPGDVKSVCSEIRDAIMKHQLVISVAAGITLAFLRYQLGTDRVVRVMPNTPAFAGKGMTVIASSARTRKKDIVLAEKIFGQVGDVLILDEKHMDAVTAVSGSGPAFVSLFIEAMVDGAVRMGIQRENALKLVTGTVEGTVVLLNDGISLSGLREMVTSPGGTTADGLFVMEREGLKGMVIEAVEAARERASEIADQTSEVDA